MKRAYNLPMDARDDEPMRGRVAHMIFYCARFTGQSYPNLQIGIALSSY